MPDNKNSEKNKKRYQRSWLHQYLAERGFSVLIWAALFCTVCVKIFHGIRTQTDWNWVGWVLSDIAVLGGLELILAVVCFYQPRRWIIRTANSLAFLVYFWAFLNTGLLIRTGVQILPTVLLPFFRAPLNSLAIVGVGIIKQPVAASVVILPSVLILVFYILVMTRPLTPDYKPAKFKVRVLLSLFVVFSALGGRVFLVQPNTTVSEELVYNCHLKAFTMFFSDDRVSREYMEKANRIIPKAGQVNINKTSTKNPDIVMLILEGVQYKYTSLGDNDCNLTPYLKRIAEQGVSFSKTRTSLMHTTKAIFSLLTGRYPCVNQDLAETVPVKKPYESIATILERQNYKTAFFQSAKGSFEARPGLVHNLGFDYFWSREDVNDKELYVGSLGCDEFVMLDAVKNWLKKNDKPSFTVLLCSVTHDPYEVPKWYAQPVKEHIQRYKQTIRYTDEFIRELDVQMKNTLGCENYLLCIVGDHAEAFGEHGLYGHERLAFEEVLRVPWVMKGRFIDKGRKVNRNTASIDIAPTLLSAAGCELDDQSQSMDGVNTLAYKGNKRKLYFSGWLQESPTGFVLGDKKYFHNPQTQKSVMYNLKKDPQERNRKILNEKKAETLKKDLFEFRRNSLFKIEHPKTSEIILYDRWRCKSYQRLCEAEYIPEEKTQE